MMVSIRRVDSYFQLYSKKYALLKVKVSNSKQKDKKKDKEQTEIEPVN